ncbi:MAG: purine-binding chemotaxis protein CheW [Planctomycetes bacterium]|nr:purine-binding chemotaxis protein CheW [Planctomycetota bacterium]
MIDNGKATAAAFSAGKFLSFYLSKEEYGIAILKVREIIGMVDVTPLPKTPDFVKGVINLRGKIIPVIDLRLKFGMEPAEYTNETCIVVVDIDRDGESPIQIGCIVDTVSEVLSVDSDQFETAPRCADAQLDYIDGLAKLKDRVIILLDIDCVVGDLNPALSGLAA